LPFSKSRTVVVPFSDASMPSMLEMPQMPPPHPPRMSDACAPATGKVRPQKMSLPSTRMASSAIS
jgi:hypothetical protein